MFALHGRWLLPACLLLASSAAAGGEAPRTNPSGDPLPKGARFHLGTAARHRLEPLALAADGRTLLTRSAEGTLTVWDVRDGRRLRTLEDGEGNIDRFLFGADANQKRAVLRQEAGKRRQRSGSPPERSGDSAFSPDSTMMAFGGDQGGTTILLHQTAKGIEQRRLSAEASVKQIRNLASPGVVCQMIFAPDGRVLAVTYSGGFLILWDTRSGQPRHVVKFPRHGEPYRSLVFSSDGRLLALSDRSVLLVLETVSGQQFWKRPLGEHWIDSSAFAPDNRTLAIGDAGSHAAIHLWDLVTNKEFHTLQGHRDGIEKLIFSPDGNFLLSGSGDKTVLCWDIAAILPRSAFSKHLTPAKLTALWTDLASKDAVCGQRAVGELILAHEAALPFLEKSLPPVTPAQLARIAAWIADLDHAEFAHRDRATTELEKLGSLAAPALRQALTEKPSLEMRRRIEALLHAIDARPLSPAELRTIRGAQVMETIGTPAARRILESLAHGAAEALVTQETRAARERLERRQAKP